METLIRACGETSVADLLKIVAVLIAAAGLFANAWQHRRTNNKNSTEQVANVLWKIYDDKELSDIYYKIEYDDFKYNKDFHGSENEKKLDKLISIFDILAKQYYKGLISLRDFDLICYEYLIIYQNSEIKNYFLYLDHWFDSRNISEPSFNKFRALGKIIEDNHFKQ